MSWFNGEAVISTGARFQLSTVPLPKKTTVNFKMQILVRQRQKLQSETQFLGCKFIFYLFPKAGVIQSVKSVEGADILTTKSGRTRQAPPPSPVAEQRPHQPAHPATQPG